MAVNTQRIRVNDRLAFPDGCSSASNYVYPGLCANGDVDIYDYRSDGERRSLSVGMPASMVNSGHWVCSTQPGWV